jgi:hypothetical protein
MPSSRQRFSAAELLRYFRTLWTVAFAAAMLIALSQRERYSWTQVLDSLVVHAFVLDRAALRVVGLVLIVVLGFIFWYPVKLSQNLTILRIGIMIKVAVQTMRVMLLAWRPSGLGVSHYGCGLNGVPCVLASVSVQAR